MTSALNIYGKTREDGRVTDRRRDRKTETKEEK